MPGTASFDLEFWTGRLWALLERERQLDAGELHPLRRGIAEAIREARYTVAHMLRDHQAAMSAAGAAAL